MTGSDGQQERCPCGHSCEHGPHEHDLAHPPEPSDGQQEREALSDADEDTARSWIVYRWTCPFCGDVDEDEVEQSQATCSACGREFLVRSS